MAAALSLSRVACSVEEGVGVLKLARPDRSNAMDKDMWEQIPQGLRWLEDNGARAVSGAAPSSGRL